MCAELLPMDNLKLPHLVLHKRPVTCRRTLLQNNPDLQVHWPGMTVAILYRA